MWGKWVRAEEPWIARSRRPVAGNMLAGPPPPMYHSLRVDDHPDPAAGSRRIDEPVVEQSRRNERDYGSAAARSFGRVKH